MNRERPLKVCYSVDLFFKKKTHIRSTEKQSLPRQMNSFHRHWFESYFNKLAAIFCTDTIPWPPLSSLVDPQQDWTPHRLEVCLWAMTIATQLQLSLVKDVDVKGSGVAAKCSDPVTDQRPTKKLKTRWNSDYYNILKFISNICQFLYFFFGLRDCTEQFSGVIVNDWWLRLVFI